MWADMRNLGWTVYLWNDKINLPWFERVSAFCVRVVRVVSSSPKLFTSATFAAGMKRVVGATVWNEMLDVVMNLRVLGEAIPFEKKEIKHRDGLAHQRAHLKREGGE